VGGDAVQMQKRLLVAGAAVVALAVLGGGGAYVYFFSGLRTSPPTLALASPSAASSPSTGASPATSTGAVTPAGAWQIGTGSVAGYRVKEQFVGQTSSHEAVARTSDVTGQLAITASGGAYQLTSGSVTVQLTSLASVDQVAGYNVTNRDRLVAQSLALGQYPTAVFQAQPVTLPAGVESGQTVTVSVPGQLTIHGVTKDVTATVQVRVTGSTAQAAGSISTNMTDFAVSPPAAPFTTVQTAVTLEFQLNLTRTA
jgi:polyisoprenoid-binding protein YceI